MTMHLVGPYMTTTNYKKRKAKNKTKKMLEAEARHDKWLRKMNAHPDQIAENKKKNAGNPIRSIPNCFCRPGGFWYRPPTPAAVFRETRCLRFDDWLHCGLLQPDAILLCPLAR